MEARRSPSASPAFPEILDHAWSCLCLTGGAGADDREADDGGGAPARSPAGQDGTTPAGPRSCRILIVEDNWLIAIEMEAALSEAGYEVVGLALDAEQAVQLCAAGQPDLVLMDVRLQGQAEGIDAALEIRARFGVGSVFVTAHGEPETRARAEPAKPLGWILKPIASEELVRRLDQILAPDGPLES